MSPEEKDQKIESLELENQAPSASVESNSCFICLINSANPIEFSSDISHSLAIYW
ncbi:hypothetical protein [Nostoc sp. CALU 546]|uniref:hypothetical protein n=1 Tax=Nostoc sp. CALU 546 TaxID=1867241 RepID=UPI003B6735E3